MAPGCVVAVAAGQDGVLYSAATHFSDTAIRVWRLDGTADDGAPLAVGSRAQAPWGPGLGPGWGHGQARAVADVTVWGLRL